jgi:hypothetical protein
MARATAFFFILLACAASLLAGTAAPAEAAKPCWERVLDDWSQDSDIDGTYPPSCISQAIAKVPEDVLAYTDFVDQAEAARQVAPRQLQSADPDSGSGSGSGSGGPSSETQPPRKQEPDTSKDEGPISSVLGSGNNNADSFPLPLLILLGLSGALIAAGGAGYGARKLRAHRAKP